MRLFLLDFVAMLVACMACIAVAGAASVATEMRSLFVSLDQNQDGQLQTSEVTQQRMFARLVRTSDTNGDGQLSPTEFSAGLQPQKPEKPMLAKQGSTIPGANAFVILIYKMDANGDHRVERDEVPRDLVPIFDRIITQADGNKNGTLDRREIAQGAPRLARAAMQIADRLGIDVKKEMAKIPKAKLESLYQMNGREPLGDMLANPKDARRLFAQIDSDSNGQLTTKEVPEQFAKRFQQILKRADHNDDKQLNIKEFLAFSERLAAQGKRMSNPEQTAKIVQRLLRNFDTDEDRMISRSEAPPKMAERFDEVDANGDGQVDRAELERIAPHVGRILRAGK